MSDPFYYALPGSSLDYSQMDTNQGALQQLLDNTDPNINPAVTTPSGNDYTSTGGTSGPSNSARQGSEIVSAITNTAKSAERNATNPMMLIPPKLSV